MKKKYAIYVARERVQQVPRGLFFITTTTAMLLCRAAKNRDRNVNTLKRKPHRYTKRLNEKRLKCGR